MSKPFQLLKTFSKKELNDFQKLLDSGYLSPNERLSKLLKILIKRVRVYKSFTSKLQFDLYKTLYGKENFQSKKLSKLMSDLLKAAENFLMFERIKKSDEHKLTLLFPELINRKQINLYGTRVKAAEKKLSKVKKRGDEYYNQYCKIQEERARLSYLTNTLIEKDNYDELQYYEDIKYLLQKLQYHLAKVTLQTKYAHKTFNLKPFDALQALLDLEEYQSNPLIQLYLLNIQLVKREEDTTFRALSKLLKEQKEIIPPDFLKPFYTNLNNYCIYQLYKGNLNYYNYLFEIYKDMHNGRLLANNNTIELLLLKNMIITACRAKEFDWAVDKLNYYLKYVSSKHKHSVLKYNKGIVAFYKKKYVETIEHFNQVKKIDYWHHLSLKTIQLQCFYEIDLFYETSTENTIQSLKTYLYQNKKLTKRHKESYFNFIRIFEKLYKFKDIPDKRTKRTTIENRLPKLKDLLSHFKFIKEKRWLMLKIRDLES